MMVMTAKVDFKKIMLGLAAVAALILSALLLLGEGDTAQTNAPALANNDQRVQFLRNFGWDVTTSPQESSQVKIPRESTEVFDRYNTLQKGQGYDLSKYAGKKVMRYVYQINNYPGAAEPVYATLLTYKNEIIGGDITNTAANGKIQGFQMPGNSAPTAPSAPPASSVPSQPSEPSPGAY